MGGCAISTLPYSTHVYTIVSISARLMWVESGCGRIHGIPIQGTQAFEGMQFRAVVAFDVVKGVVKKLNGVIHGVAIHWEGDAIFSPIREGVFDGVAPAWRLTVDEFRDQG
jgi:hypothetical protein